MSLIFVEAVAATLGSGTALDPHIKNSLEHHYGSLFNAMWTLYLSTSGGEDWAPMGLPLKSTGMGYYYLFIFYPNFQSIALLNVVLGLFVDTAMKAAGTDHAAVLAEDADARATLAVDILKLFRGIDAADGTEEAAEEEDAGDGIIDRDELEISFSFPTFQAFLQQMELDKHEIINLFTLISRHKGHVCVEDLVAGCFRVGRSAKSIDIMNISQQQEGMRENIETTMASISRLESRMFELSSSIRRLHGSKN